MENKLDKSIREPSNTEKTRQLLSIYNHNVVAGALSIISVVSVLAYVNIGQASNSSLALWFVAMVFLSLARIAGKKLYLAKRFANDLSYLRYISINQTLTALSWSFVTLVLLDINELSNQLISFISIAAVSAAATTTMAGFVRIGTIYLSLTLLPGVYHVLLEFEHNKFELGGIILVYLVFLIVALVRNSASVFSQIDKNIELASKESLLRTVIDASVDAIISLDSKGSIVDLNRAALKMFGCDAGAVIGTPITRLIALGEDAHFFTQLHQIEHSEPPERNKTVAIRADGGNTRTVEMLLRPARANERNLLILNIHDLTDILEQERARQSAEQRALDLMQSVDSGIMEIDAAANIKFANLSALAILDYPADQLLDQSLCMLLPEDEANESNQDLIQTPEIHLREMSLLDRRGEPIYVNLSKVPLLRDGAESSIISFTDISASFDILQEQKRLRQISEASPELMIILSLEGEILSINKAARRVFRLDEARGDDNLTLRDIISDSELLTFINNEAIPQAFASGSWQGELVFRASGGKHTDYSVFLMKLDENNRQTAYFSMEMSDITLRKAAQAELIQAKEIAEAAAQAKSEFLATMSHEIRTPMNGILGMAELLEDSELDSEQSEFASTITRSGRALLTIINDILDFSKVEAGQMSLESIGFDLERSAYEVCNLLMPRASEKGIELILNYAVDNPRQLRGDPGRIRQILVNLIGNAVKFTEQGHVIVQIRNLGEVNAQTATMEFSVIDTGIGISKENLARLFQSFTQADSSTTRKYGGTGLGLTIAKQLVELMDGRIEVTSTPGKGSCFSFVIELPVISDYHALSHKTLLARRVLIVDDNSVNLHVLRNQLQHFGMKVRTANNPEQTLKDLREAARQESPIELVVLDYQMPDMDGAELGRQIIADPRIPSCPLVAYSSMARRGDARLFEKIGFTGYLTKPALSDVLYATLESVLGEFEAHGGEAGPIITKYDILETSNGLTGKRDFSGQRVLLAEDNPVNQMVAKTLLEKHHFEVTVAANGQEAIDSFQREGFDVILMDCHMPVMDGYAATRAINQLQGDKDRRIPIIALTANATETDRDDCLAAGMDWFVAKPFSSNTLLGAIESSLNPDTAGLASNVAHEYPSPLSLDVEILSELKESMDEDFDELVQAYLTSGETMLEQLWLAQPQQDFESMARLAHSLKSSSANLGALKLSHQAAALEDESRNAIPLQTESLQALNDEFNRVRSYLQQHT